MEEGWVVRVLVKFCCRFSVARTFLSFLLRWNGSRYLFVVIVGFGFGRWILDIRYYVGIIVLVIFGNWMLLLWLERVLFCFNFSV